MANGIAMHDTVSVPHGTNPNQLQTAESTVFSGQPGGAPPCIFPEMDKPYTIRKNFHVQLKYHVKII
jgi:hypothetical protein